MKKKRKIPTSSIKDIAKSINKKFGNSLDQQLIIEGINTIISEIKEILVKDECLSVENFGTLSPYIKTGHKGIDVNTREIQFVKPNKYIKFIPSSAFLEIIHNRKEFFNKKT
jgi:nucleoid DNA-binding protein